MSKIKDTIIDRQELGLDIDLSSEPDMCFWCGKRSIVRQLSCAKCIGSSRKMTEQLNEGGWGSNYPIWYKPE